MALFDGITFALAPSLPPDRHAVLAGLLAANGAAERAPRDATHIITDSDFDDLDGGWQDVRPDAVKVTEAWVERSLLLGKRQGPQYFSPDPAMLFSGIVATATDISPTDIEVLSAGITALGGQWRAGLTRDTTHLFALADTSAKYATALHYQPATRVRVLAPHWFDDSVRLGIRGLATAAYEWPSPRVLAPPALAATLASGVDAGGAGAARITSAKRALFRGVVQEQAGAGAGGSVARSDVWAGRRILLCADLELSEGRRSAVDAGIARAGGTPLHDDDDRHNPTSAPTSTDEFDVLVCRYRWGPLYVQAVRAKKLVGSLAWLFHVEATGALSAPAGQLLHYPVPRTPIPGFSAHEITVTNYTGEAREYLKRLIALMGATFTPSLTGKNTVVIAALLAGNKTHKARSWSIPIVNHTWLEDCFVQWRSLSVGLDKYVAFPPGLDFAEHLGERGVARAVVLESVDELAALAADGGPAHDDGGPADDGGGPAAAAISDRDAEEEEVEDAMAGPAERMDVDSAPEDDGHDAAYAPDADGHLPASDADDVDQPMDVDDDDDDDASPSPAPRKTPARRNSAAARPLGKRRAPAEAAPSREAPARARSPVIELSDDDSDDGGGQAGARVERLPGKKAGPGPSTRAGKGKRVEHDGSDDGMDDGESVAPVKPSPKKAGPSTRARKAKRDGPVEHDDSDDGGEAGSPVKQTPKKKAGPSTRAGKAKRVEHDERDDSDDGESGSPVKQSPKKKAGPSTRAGKAKRVEHDDSNDGSEAGSPVKQSPKKKNAPSTRAGKAKRDIPVEHDSDDGSEAGSPVKQSPKRKAGPSTRAGKAKRVEHDDSDGGESVAPVEQSPKKKAGPSTRAGKAKRVEHDGSDDESVAPVKQSPKNKKAPSTRAGKAKRDGPLEHSDSDDDGARSSPTKAKSSKKAAPANRGGRRALDPSDHEDTPAQSVSPAKGKASNRAAPSSRVGRQAPAKSSTARAPSLAPSDTEDSDEETLPRRLTAGPASRAARQSVSTPSKASKPVPKTTPAAAAATPRRTLSVVMPPLGTGTALASPRPPSPSKSGAATKAGTSAAEETPGGARKAPPRHPPALSVADSSVDVEHEMEVPASVRKTARRSAANKATQKLHDVLMPDLLSFAKEMRKGSIRDPGPSDTGKAKTREKEVATKKRRSSARADDGELEEEENDARDAKKRRLSQAKGKGKATAPADDDAEEEAPGPSARRKKTVAQVETDDSSSIDQPVRFLTTQVALSDDITKALTKLGAKTAVKANECTYLIVNNIVRTEKFLCAMAVAPHIVTEKWATASAAAKKLLPPDKYRLHDAENERKYDFKLTDALARAKSHEGRLFAGMVFYVTNKVPVDKKLLKNVVAAHGGQVRTQNPTTRIFAGKEKHYVVSCPEDAPVWRPLAQAQHPIYTQELLLNAALTQSIRWDVPAHRVVR